MVTGSLREHLEQYLRTTLTAAARSRAGQAVAASAVRAGAGCAHDLANLCEWAYRRRLDGAALTAWAKAAGARCDHELLALLDRGAL